MGVEWALFLCQLFSLKRLCISLHIVGIFTCVDDPLSAVDAHVSHRLLDEVFLSFLAGKTRILVTQKLHICMSLSFSLFFISSHDSLFYLAFFSKQSARCDRVCIFSL